MKGNPVKPTPKPPPLPLKAIRRSTLPMLALLHLVPINPANGELGPEAAPGSPVRLETSAATMYLAESSVIGGGPTGPSVLLDFSLSFKPPAAGRTYRVEAFATDDFGHEQGFETLGTLTVLER